MQPQRLNLLPPAGRNESPLGSVARWALYPPRVSPGSLLQHLGMRSCKLQARWGPLWAESCKDAGQESPGTRVLCPGEQPGMLSSLQPWAEGVRGLPHRRATHREAQGAVPTPGAGMGSQLGRGLS